MTNTYTSTETSTDTRRLVTIERIASTQPIPGADAIETVQVRGWTVVTRKGDFAPGDTVVYIEVDAALPVSDERFAFLGARGVKTFGGERVHVLRTARLRGVYSQGIVFPIAAFPELTAAGDTRLEELLGITKYEPPLPPGMAALSEFPGFLTKTDAERVQNLDDATWALIQADRDAWVATEKIDGSSLTAWRTADGVLHVAGRNWELDPAKSNPHWEAIEVSLLGDHLEVGQWAQGEVAGPGVQGNPLKLDARRLVLFGHGTFDAAAPARTTTRTLGHDQWPAWARDLAAPTYEMTVPDTIAEAITQVEKLTSLLAPRRGAEGIVWTRRDGIGLAELDGRAVWKSISARYLTKHGG